MKNRLSIYIATALLCVIFLASAAQADRCALARGSLKELDQEQSEWIASNKQLITGIAILSASDRIENIAVDELGLEKIKPESVKRVLVGGVKIDG